MRLFERECLAHVRLRTFVSLAFAINKLKPNNILYRSVPPPPPPPLQQIIIREYYKAIYIAICTRRDILHRVPLHKTENLSIVLLKYEA